MTYRTWLQPWCIVRHLPNAQSIIVERFRNRGEAESYLKTLRRLLPQVTHSLMFDNDLMDCPLSERVENQTPNDQPLNDQPLKFRPLDRSSSTP